MRWRMRENSLDFAFWMEMDTVEIAEIRVE